MLCDAGAENNNHYASDFTRTTAVGGRYTQQQIDIHNIVLRALNHSIAAAKPGVSYQTVHQEAYRIIFEDLRDLGLTSGNPDEALEDGAPALFMPHGLGHAMGLDVHDMENLGETFVGYGSAIQRDTRFGYRSLRFGRVLEPGHVITVEPGIYFIPELIHKWEKAHRKSPFINYKEVKKYLPVGGIRLEDNIVITPTGNRFVYERRLPVTIDEIRETVEEDRNPRSRHRPGVV
jgi:Xaa-Pro aminopeptidase